MLHPRCTFLCLTLLAASVSAQTSFEAREMPSPNLDGRLSAGEWEAALKLPDLIDPVTGKPPTDRTDVWVGFDGENAYVAFRCHDSDPSGIVARERQRGAEFDGEDFVVVMFDPFLQRHWAAFSRFRVNALGTQNEEISGGRSSKREWRGDWKAAVSRDAGGWSVEIAIPWRILNLPPSGRRDVGLVVRRFHQRPNVMSQFPNLGLDERLERCAVLRGVPILASAKPLDAQAYLSPDFTDRESELRYGLDLRYRITPQLTAVGSFKPDFVNVEQQVAGIEFTRTERKLEDSRPFFTEGSAYFWLTSPYTFAQMFYSRRIGEFDFGAKLFGKANSQTDVGALVAQKDGDKTDAVFKVGYQFNPRSWASAYGTSRQRPGYASSALGASVGYGSGQWTLDTEFAVNDDDGDRSKAGSLGLAYSGPKLFAVLRHVYVEPGFFPALGYVTFDNRRGVYLFSEYNADFRGGPFKGQYGSLFVSRYDRYDGTAFERSFSLDGGVTTRKDLRLGFSANVQEFLGAYEQTLGLGMAVNASDRTRRAEVYGNFGHRDGASTSYVSAGLNRRFGKIDLGLGYARQSYLGEAEQTILTVGSELDERRSITSRIVFQDGRTNAYLAFRNAGFAGTEWYVILGDPNAPEWHTRLAAKLVWAW
ncbi:MAG: carbohydrate binding family 9 domain-containing protein [Fimbriimonadales bacterium]|nr:carbohydrate binding family 9 domain-containing protein [Fimbriimonadales bacterium]